MKSKLIKCKSCGSDVAKGTNVCPNCGAKQHSFALKICYLIIALAVGVIIGTLINSSSTTNHAGNPSPSQDSGLSLPEEMVLFDGSYAKVTFLKAYEEKSITGAFYLQLLVENKSSNIEEWVYLDSANVDDLAVNTGSGVPIVIESGKSSSAPFIVFYNGDLSDVKKIEFKVVVADHITSTTLEKSETLSISLDES